MYNSFVILGNLSPFITEEILTREFGNFGKIESIKIIPPKAENIKHFIAFINFSNASSAENALLAKQNKIILGQPVKIKYGKKLSAQLTPITTKPIINELSPNKAPLQQNQTQFVNNIPIIPQTQSLIDIPVNGVNTPTINNNICNLNQTTNLNPNFIPNIPFQMHHYPQQNIPFQQYPQISPYNQFYPYPQNPNFPNYPIFTMPYIYVKFPESADLKNRIDKISELVFKVKSIK
jgi:RNA recognition motif-containing protein